MAVAFLDTETTALHRDRRAWDIAVIRRERDGTESDITIFVDIADLDIDNADPEALAKGRFYERHPGLGFPLQAGQVHVREVEAARLVQQWTADATIYGVNPSFDTDTLAPMLWRHGLTRSWYFQPQDISSQAYGYVLRSQMPEPNSEWLSVECGVPVPTVDRHTAMGDARWVQRWYDQLHKHHNEVVA